MLLCDFCKNGWHTYCIEPGLRISRRGASYVALRLLQQRLAHVLPGAAARAPTASRGTVAVPHLRGRWVCGFPDEEHLVLLCDFCNNGRHTYCLETPLEHLPSLGEPWLCPTCEEGGDTKQQLVEVVRDRQASRTNAPPRNPSDVIHKLQTATGDKAANGS